MSQPYPPSVEFFSEWRRQLAGLARTKPWLAGLLRRRRRLFRRFAYFYRRLRALPRRQRRLLHRKLGPTLAGAALLLALSGVPVQAAAISVAAGEVEINPNGVCSLIEAIENANDSATGQPHADCAAGDPGGADIVTLPAGGSFTLTAAHNTAYGPTGLPVISSEMTIAGNGAAIERDETAPDFRLLVVNASGDLTLNETTLTGGRADIKAGALLNRGVTTIANSAISGNETVSGSGGGVYNSRQSVLTIDQSLIAGNSATPHGGGVFNAFGGTLEINDSAISGNSTNNGGGVANFGAGTITNSAIFANEAYDNGYGSGGGLLVGTGGVTTIANSTISGNKADNGGGLRNFGLLTINNSTISGNSARLGGGVSNNANSTITLDRSIVSGNSASLSAEIFNGGVLDANNYNLLGYAGLIDAEAFFSFTPGSKDVTATIDGSAPTPLDDILDPLLADNGGPTPTHALVAGSPALDAAPSAACAAAPLNGLDQRGEARSVDGDGLGDSGNECDIGAFELQPAPAPEGRLTIVKTLLKNDQLAQVFSFEGPAGLFTLTTNTPANRQTFELPPAVHTFRELPAENFGLLSVACVDEQDQDVTGTVVDFSAVDMAAEITLAEGDDLTCTFLNEEATFEDDGHYQLYLPAVLQ